ncbi:hypothetical protein BD410DRAFT_806388 [Rickenella mellea]|uniref:F-box domain-containing protein n=1 Tax=Rickenella mellea TaxID=50990 RepID=A0A4Y7PUW3_9AGAM|nr:hypothetical protein BD410DRAFT_806388 [Rickenella mellea]
MEVLGLEGLVDDILIRIVGALCVQDILSVRLTSRRFETISRLRNVWHTVLHRDVVDCGLPVPGALRSLPYSPSSDLEKRAIQALRLHRRWVTAKVEKPSVSKFLVKDSKLWANTILLVTAVMSLQTHRTKERLDLLLILRTFRYNYRWNYLRYKGVLPCDFFEVGCGMERKRSLTPIAQSYDVIGKVVIIVDNLLGFLCNPQEGDMRQGIEFMNWLDNSGSALLVNPDNIFGSFIGIQFHDDTIVVAWQHILCVYSIPLSLPNIDRRHEVHPTTIFATSIPGPIAFTGCHAHRHRRASPPTPLTIITVSNGRPVVRLLTFVTLQDGSLVCKLTRLNGSTGFAYGHNNVSDIMRKDELRVGPSGRGIRVDPDGKLFLCIPRTLVSAHGVIESVDFYPQSQVCWVGLEAGEERVLDFDDSTGRMVIANGDAISVMEFC